MVLTVSSRSWSIAVAFFALAGCASLPDEARKEGGGAATPAVTAAAAPASPAAAAPATATAAAPAAPPTPTAPKAPTTPGTPEPPTPPGTTPGPGGGAPAAAAPGARPAVPVAPPAPGTPRPFAEVVKDAKEIPGYFRLWQKDEKVWIELPEDRFNAPFFLAINLSRGLGEGRLLAGLMGYGGLTVAGGSYVVEFRKIGPLVQLIARNTRFVARPGTPEALAVQRAFSDSLLAAAPVQSQPHPERKSILIEANTLLGSDIGRGGTALEASYRNAFAYDRANSFIAEAKSTPEQTTFDVTNHYAQARVPLPPATPSPAPYFPPPTVIEDPRSLFLGFYFTFTALPAQPMRPRLADSRVGHFALAKTDFTDERSISPVRHYVERWRLEKKDPAAAVSDPVKPIVFWLDREIPERYRAPITAGILEWNKAFERIGIRNAIEVKLQPAGADFSTSDALHASVRWMTTATTTFGAIGPSQVDPRTGEILDADIGIDANITRAIRHYRVEAVPEGWQPMYDEHTGALRIDPMQAALGVDRYCNYMQQAAREYGFALALLEARGEIDPDSAQADRFVDEFLRDTMMHEVGHTLGLRHNFRASTAFSSEQIADPEFTAKNGISGSVMEYNPFNLAQRGERQASYSMGTLGPYDYWAIEFAYRPFTAEEEPAGLARIASRSTEPELAYATDEESMETLDPEVNTFDLGRDTLAYYRKRMNLSRELWERLERKELLPGETYSVLRRRFFTGLTQVGIAMGLAAKHVGGVTALRDHAGSNRAPLTPVPLARQREALQLVTDQLFRSESFRFSPDFMRRLVTDPLERVDARRGISSSGTDLSLSDIVGAMQRDVLARLMSPLVAQRLLAAEPKLANPAEGLRLSELLDTLQRAIWAEAAAGAESTLLRRNLQREHLRRVTAALVGPSAATPADARALHRQNAQQLREALLAAARRPGLSRESQAHYAESADTLAEALKAPILRAGG